jgi:hypothetical protein
VAVEQYSLPLSLPFLAVSLKDMGYENIKFVVKVDHGDARAPEYVQRVDPTRVHMTTNRKLAFGHGQAHGRRRRQVPADFPVHLGVGVGASQCLLFALRTVRERH